MFCIRGHLLEIAFRELAMILRQFESLSAVANERQSPICVGLVFFAEIRCLDLVIHIIAER